MKFSGHKNAITSLNYDEENNLVLSSAKDGLLKVWDLTIGSCIDTIATGTNEIWCVEKF